MNSKKLQLDFFALVRQKSNDNDKLIDELKELLDVSKSTLYKRLNGDIKMTVDELITIATRYDISIDNLLHHQRSNVSLELRSLAAQPKSFDDFLEPILLNLTMLSKLKEKEVWYATNEMPFFHYLHFPRLAAFKLYIWGRSVWDIEHIKQSKFTIASATEDFRELIKKALDLYEDLPSTEFWGTHVLDTTLNQIKYCIESQLFEQPKHGLLLLEDLEELLKLMEKKATQGIKSNEVRFTLYHNEMLYTNNMILVRTEYGDGLYITYDNPNFMYTKSHQLCAYTTKWFSKLKRNAQCISLENEKYRHQYFDELRSRVDGLRAKLEVVI